MSGGKDNFLSLLKVLTVSFASLSDDQYEKLLSGQARLVYQELSKSPGKAKSKNLPDDKEINEHINRLTLFSSREEAQAYLKATKLTRAGLGEIASQLRVHLLKSDKKEQMINKIVEAVVGARLRSEAIRDTDLKGGPALNFIKR